MKSMASPKSPSSAPPPPTTQPRRRRSRSTSSSASSSATSSSSFSSTPSPSPFHHYFSSSIPFSWEKTPGIPKMPSKTLDSRQNPPPPLPLPNPPLRKFSGGKFAGDADPFAAALIECAKDPPSESDPWIGSRSAIKTGRRFSMIGVLDLYGSCKSSCSVSRSTTIEIPRVRDRIGAYLVLNRRVG